MFVTNGFCYENCASSDKQSKIPYCSNKEVVEYFGKSGRKLQKQNDTIFIEIDKDYCGLCRHNSEFIQHIIAQLKHESAK